jgi:hypothetical protein
LDKLQGKDLDRRIHVQTFRRERRKKNRSEPSDLARGPTTVGFGGICMRVKPFNNAQEGGLCEVPVNIMVAAGGIYLHV